MHEDVLILPDGGRDFMETIRLSALYADRVHIFTPTRESTLNVLQSFVEISFPSPAFVDENLDELIAEDEEYSRFLEANPASKSLIADLLKKEHCEHPGKDFLLKTIAYRSELDLLKREAILTSISDDLTAPGVVWGDVTTGYLKELQASVDNAGGTVFPEGTIPESYYLSEKAISDPTITFLVECLFTSLLRFADSIGKLPEHVVEKLCEKENTIDKIAVGIYFLLAGFYSSQRGCVGVSSHADTLRYYDRCCEILTRGSEEHNDLSLKRDRIRAILGDAVLRDTVPDVSNIPLPEILEIRRKREPELISFREGLNALAADIDPTLADSELQSAIEKKIQTVVKPALGDLRRSIQSASIGSYSDAIRDSLVAGGVPFLIASTVGAPPEMSPLKLGAMGVLLQKLVDFTVGKHLKKNQLLASNQWSVLFHLNKRK